VKKVLIYSFLLVLGLIGSQFLGSAPHAFRQALQLGTMFALAFIMIHVGYEFEIDKRNLKSYAWDGLVAVTAASFPWLLCAVYFVFVLSPSSTWWTGSAWTAALLEGLFAASTSAGVLFAMLAAAGLGATWVFRKARVLAIFDDLSTLLLIIPLKAMIIGPKWQLAVVAFVVVGLLWVALRYLNTLRWSASWPWVFFYAACIVGLSEAIYAVSGKIDPSEPIHLEVLLPAFVMGCLLRSPDGTNNHADHSIEGTEEGPEHANEQFVSTIVSAGFMVLVGLSMPSITGGASHDTVATSQTVVETTRTTLHARGIPFPGWPMIGVHVLMITLISNLGKMFPALCYRREASLKERLALSVAMFPRGEVGAGVLLIALGYGLGGTTLTIAVLSLALNLLCTGVFIVGVKKLTRSAEMDRMTNGATV